MNSVDGQASCLIGSLLKNFFVLHSRRVGEKLFDLLGLAVDGENYLNFFIKYIGEVFLDKEFEVLYQEETFLSILINNIPRTKLNFVFPRIDLDLLRPDCNDIGVFVLVDTDKKILLVWG